MGREGARYLRQNAVVIAVWSCAGVLACLAAYGCGYTFATTPLSQKYTTIAVPAFRNQTIEENLQIRFNNILVRKLVEDGRLRVVDHPGTADLVLSGELVEYVPRAISLVKDDNIDQFQITIVAQASLEAPRNGGVLWQDDVITGVDFYLTEGGRTREEAINSALEKLAEQILYEALDTYW
jgi:hypothetical protein